MNSISINKELHYVYSNEDFANLIGEKLSVDARDYIMKMVIMLEDQHNEIEHLEGSIGDCEDLENDIYNLENQVDMKDDEIEKLQSELYKLKNRKLRKVVK